MEHPFRQLLCINRMFSTKALELKIKPCSNGTSISSCAGTTSSCARLLSCHLATKHFKSVKSMQEKVHTSSFCRKSCRAFAPTTEDCFHIVLVIRQLSVQRTEISLVVALLLIINLHFECFYHGGILFFFNDLLELGQRLQRTMTCLKALLAVHMSTW